MTDTPASPAATEMARRIGEAFDQFESIYVPELPTEHHWLLKQRLGRLCEEVVRRATSDLVALRAENERLKSQIGHLIKALKRVRNSKDWGHALDVAKAGIAAHESRTRAALAEGRADGKLP